VLDSLHLDWIPVFKMFLMTVLTRRLLYGGLGNGQATWRAQLFMKEPAVMKSHVSFGVVGSRRWPRCRAYENYAE
jgi:hypothetical protein